MEFNFTWTRLTPLLSKKINKKDIYDNKEKTINDLLPENQIIIEKFNEKYASSSQEILTHINQNYLYKYINLIADMDYSDFDFKLVPGILPSNILEELHRELVESKSSLYPNLTKVLEKDNLNPSDLEEIKEIFKVFVTFFRILHQVYLKNNAIISALKISIDQ